MVKYKGYEPEVSAVTCLLLFLCSHLFGWWWLCVFFFGGGGGGDYVVCTSRKLSHTVKP